MRGVPSQIIKNRGGGPFKAPSEISNGLTIFKAHALRSDASEKPSDVGRAIVRRRGPMWQLHVLRGLLQQLAEWDELGGLVRAGVSVVAGR
jgi:hypothetical protein